MAEGNSSYNGLALPLNGEYEQVQQTAANDMQTMTGASGQTGDFLVCQNSSGVERFVVEDGGNIVIVSSTASDDLIALTQAGTPTGNAFVLKDSTTDHKKTFQIDANGRIRTMCLGTVAIGDIASNASTSFSLAGLTTDDAVWLFPLKVLTTGAGVAIAYAQGTTRVDVYAHGASVASNTYAVWAFRTAAN